MWIKGQVDGQATGRYASSWRGHDKRQESSTSDGYQDRCLPFAEPEVVRLELSPFMPVTLTATEPWRASSVKC